jgi:phage-related minor tail protein
LEAAEVFGLFGDKGEKELSRVDEFFNDLGDTIDGFADDAADAIADFVETGKLDFKDMVDSMLRDLLRLGIQYSITDPLFGMIRGAFSAKGNVFGSSGDVVPFAKGGVVTVPTMFPISNRKVGIMGEGMKEEAILPLERGANGRLGVSAYGMGSNVSIVVNDMRSAGDPDIDISESASATGGRQISINIAKAVKDEMARGFFDDVLGYSLGVRRRGGAY